MSDKYNERVRALATEMAQEKYPETFKSHINHEILHPGSWQALYYQRQENFVIDQMMPAARIAVARMAEQAVDAYHSVEQGYCMGAGTYLKEQGLIPDSSHPFESSNFAKFMKGYYGDSAQEEVKIGTMQPGDRGGIHNPDNPEPCPQELRCNTRNHPEGTCDCYNMGLLPQQGGR